MKKVYSDNLSSNFVQHLVATLSCITVFACGSTEQNISTEQSSATTPSSVLPCSQHSPLEGIVFQTMMCVRRGEVAAPQGFENLQTLIKNGSSSKVFSLIRKEDGRWNPFLARHTVNYGTSRYTSFVSLQNFQFPTPFSTIPPQTVAQSLDILWFIDEQFSPNVNVNISYYSPNALVHIPGLGPNDPNPLRHNSFFFAQDIAFSLVKSLCDTVDFDALPIQLEQTITELEPQIRSLEEEIARIEAESNQIFGNRFICGDADCLDVSNRLIDARERHLQLVTQQSKAQDQLDAIDDGIEFCRN